MLEQVERAYEAVFISDLHLHPQASLILRRFEAFIEWAPLHTESVYILGDFFHAWAGDDGLEPWSEIIAARLRWLCQQEVNVYFMAGNRDFLLGKRFAQYTGIRLLSEPAFIKLGADKYMLAHGDRYCTLDKGHQWFRRFTRSSWFSSFFLQIPYRFRLKMVNEVRKHSQTNKNKTDAQMDVVPQAITKHMQAQEVSYLIHGHTHKPGLSKHMYNKKEYSRYVLSDWDDNPLLLCYHKTKGLLFRHILVGES